MMISIVDKCMKSAMERRRKDVVHRTGCLTERNADERYLAPALGVRVDESMNQMCTSIA